MICGPLRADLPPKTAEILATNEFRREWKKRWREIVRADPCSWCGGTGGYADHIVPQSRVNPGQRKSWMNLTGTCAECNGRRGDAPVLQWLADPETATAEAARTRHRENARRKLLLRLRATLVRRSWKNRTGTGRGSTGITAPVQSRQRQKYSDGKSAETAERKQR